MRNNEVIEISDQCHHESSTSQQKTVIGYSQNPNSNSNDFLSERYIICCIKCKNPIKITEEVYIIKNQIYCHTYCFVYIKEIINKIKEIPQNYIRTDMIVNNERINQEFPITFDLGDELVLEIKKK